MVKSKRFQREAHKGIGCEFKGRGFTVYDHHREKGQKWHSYGSVYFTVTSRVCAGTGKLLPLTGFDCSHRTWKRCFSLADASLLETSLICNLPPKQTVNVYFSMNTYGRIVWRDISTYKGLWNHIYLAYFSGGLWLADVWGYGISVDGQPLLLVTGQRFDEVAKIESTDFRFQAHYATFREITYKSTYVFNSVRDSWVWTTLGHSFDWLKPYFCLFRDLDTDKPSGCPTIKFSSLGLTSRTLATALDPTNLIILRNDASPCLNKAQKGSKKTSI